MTSKVISVFYPIHKVFLGSSAVEQVTVNHLVAGSNPARGAIYFNEKAISTEVAFSFAGIRVAKTRKIILSAIMTGENMTFVIGVSGNKFYDHFNM